MLKFKFHIIMTTFLLINITSLGYAQGGEDASCPPDHEPFKNELKTLESAFSKLSDIEKLIKEAALEEKEQKLREAIQISLDCKNNANTLIEKLVTKITENLECSECTELIHQVETDKSDCENALSIYKKELRRILIETDIQTYITRRGLPTPRSVKEKNWRGKVIGTKLVGSENHFEKEINTFLIQKLFTKTGDIQVIQHPTPVSSTEGIPSAYYEDPSGFVVSVKNLREELEQKTTPYEDAYDSMLPGDQNNFTWFGNEIVLYYPGVKLENWKNYSKKISNGSDLSSATAGKMTTFQFKATEDGTASLSDPQTGVEIKTYEVENIVDPAPVTVAKIGFDPKKMHWFEESREIYIPEDKTLIIRSYYKKKGEQDEAPSNNSESVTIIQESPGGLYVISHSYIRGERYTNSADALNIGPNTVWNPETTVEQYKTWKTALFEKFSQNP